METGAEAGASAAEGGHNCCYLCNQCSNSYASLEELERHLESHAGPGGGAEEEGRRAGDENSPSSSDTSFPLDETLKDEHGGGLLGALSVGLGEAAEAVDPAAPMDEEEELKEEIPGRRFPCRFCAKLFTSRSLLNIHYTHTHRDKPQYECEDCGRIFSVKRELATHRRIHSGEQTHACAQCGKEFGTRQLLKKHWMWHTGQRSHVCPHCGKAFFQKGHLTQHLMIHAGGRPHVCQLCAKTFIFKFDLNRHMKIHAERGYSCSKCGKAFLKEALLVDHQNKCTAEPGASPVPSSPATPRSRAPSVPSTPERKLSTQSTGPLPLFPPPPQGLAGLSLPGGPDLPGPPQSGPNRFVCILCMQEFPSQSAYALHVSYVHLRDAMFNSFQANGGGAGPVPKPPSTIFPKGGDGGLSPAALFSALSSANSLLPQPPPSQQRRASDSAALLSAQSLPPPFLNGQFSPASATSGETGQGGGGGGQSGGQASPSPTSEEALPKTEPEEAGEAAAEEEEWAVGRRLVAGCSGCEAAGPELRLRGGRLREVEEELSSLKGKVRQVRGIASSLLDSCSDFDKLWILHSKKVYSQIQSVLSSLD